MSLNYETSKSVIYGLVRELWQSACLDVFGSTRDLEYDLIPSELPQTRAEVWARVSMVEADAFKSGFVIRNGNINAYSNIGTVYIQVFSPMRPAVSIKNNDRLCALLRNGLRKLQPSLEGCRVVLTRARIVTGGQEGACIITNVVVNYEYKELI